MYFWLNGLSKNNFFYLIKCKICLKSIFRRGAHGIVTSTAKCSLELVGRRNPEARLGQLVVGRYKLLVKNVTVTCLSLSL